MYLGTGIQPEIMKKTYLKKQNETIIAQHKPYCANKKNIEKNSSIIINLVNLETDAKIC